MYAIRFVLEQIKKINRKKKERTWEAGSLCAKSLMTQATKHKSQKILAFRSLTTVKKRCIVKELSILTLVHASLSGGYSCFSHIFLHSSIMTKTFQCYLFSFIFHRNLLKLKQWWTENCSTMRVGRKVYWLKLWNLACINLSSF